ncbi:MAG: hypothetical protein QME57_00150 [Patescibacteria group bacterium]|nr:hypothetical protein [Patescibacteria group bacterium]
MKSGLIILLISGILFGISLFWTLKTPQAKTDLAEISYQKDSRILAIIEGNSLLPIVNPVNSSFAIQRIRVIVTGYSSTIDQTDLDPFITAAGTTVRDGVVATNMLPFATKIQLPELYGDKIFVVEDRMHWRKNHYHIDIWFPTRDEALQFGVKITDALILSNQFNSF